jgi:hypothetical protein
VDLFYPFERNPILETELEENKFEELPSHAHLDKAEEKSN